MNAPEIAECCMEVIMIKVANVAGFRRGILSWKVSAGINIPKAVDG